MSRIGSKRGRDKSIKNLGEPPSTKRQKPDKTAHIIQCVRRMCKFCNNEEILSAPYSINDLETCFNLLVTLPIEQRIQIITTQNVHSCQAGGTICCQCKPLLQMVQGKSYKYLNFFFANNRNLNKKKLNIIRTISYPMILSHGECFRSSILTIKLINSYSTNYYLKEYYNGAIDSLQYFTGELFLESVKDFNFFRFVKIQLNEGENHDQEIDCTETEVLNFLQTLKNRNYSKTFLLLTFFMVAYYKNFIFKSIKNAVQSVSGIDMDTLSEIMSFMLTYYASFNTFFEDKCVIKSLMCEICDASGDWQDVFVDIIRNDSEYKQLYEPDMEQYYDSEKLNLLNIEMNSIQFSFEKFKNWMKCCIHNGHCDVFTKLMEEHCEDKMNGFKFLFWYCAPHNKGEKWVSVIENQVNKYRNVIKCEQKLKEFESLCKKWKLKLNKNRKTKRMILK